MRFNARTPLRNVQHLTKYTLSQMLQGYEQNPDTICRVMVRKGVLLTIVQDARMQSEESLEQSEEEYQYNPYEGKIKRDCGLFANIIKTLEVKKQSNVINNHNQPKQRGYTYYFDQNKIRQRSRKNADCSTQEHYFQQIEIQQQNKRPSNGSPSNKENIKMEKGELFVDMNFSFDQINKQIESVKKARNEEIVEGDTIVNKIYSKNSYAEEESSKNIEIPSKQTPISSKQAPKQSFAKQSIKQTTKPPLNFARLSKQQKNTQELPPSDRLTVLKTQNDSIEGTKKTESRIVSCKQPQSIQIDFDLDINFI